MIQSINATKTNTAARIEQSKQPRIAEEIEKTSRNLQEHVQETEKTSEKIKRLEEILRNFHFLFAFTNPLDAVRHEMEVLLQNVE